MLQLRFIKITGEQKHSRLSSASVSPKTHKGERHWDTDTYREALPPASPALPPENHSLTHSELLFVMRAAEQWCRDTALTFSKVVPLNLSILTCLHAGYRACHIHQSLIPGEGMPASKRVWEERLR